MSSDNSFKNIIKSTTIFGGVQVVNIIVLLLRSKAIALLVGPSGIGFFGLLMTATSLISALTNFGLGTTAVKDIAIAKEKGKGIELNLSMTVVMKLALYTAIFGGLITILFSPILSIITFKNNNYIWSFIILSLTIFFTQITTGVNAILQGLRQLKSLAMVTVISAVCSLIFSLPLFYYYHIDGIVPSIVLTSISSSVLALFYFKKINYSKISITNKSLFQQGGAMLKLGFYFSISSIFSTAATYIVRIFITRYSDIETIGLYTAGASIVNNYVGIIFTAMAADYYPRLSAVSNNENEMGKLINQQGLIAQIILGPVIIGFIVFIKIIIIILFSRAFLPAENMMLLSVLGIFFKSGSWLLGFIILAKGDSKLFLWNEILTCTYQTALSCLGFYFYGLDGLGYSFILGFFMHFIQMILVARFKYKFAFELETLKSFFIYFMLAIITLLLVQNYSDGKIKYPIGIGLLLITISFSVFKLNKEVNLRKLISKFKGR